jgi:hypothetical protein
MCYREQSTVDIKNEIVSVFYLETKKNIWWVWLGSYVMSSTTTINNHCTIETVSDFLFWTDHLIWKGRDYAFSLQA